MPDDLPEMPNLSLEPGETLPTEPAQRAPEPEPEPTIRAPEPEPESAPPEPGLRDVFTQAGFNTSGFADDQSLASAAMDYLQRARQSAPLAEYGQQYLQHAEKFQEYLKSLEPEPEPEPAKPVFQAPEYDPRWEVGCEWNPGTRRWAAQDVEHLQAAEQLNRYVAHEQATLQKLARQPIFQTLQEQPGFADWWEEQKQGLLAQIEQHYAQKAVEDEQRAWLAEREKELWEHDANGSVVFGPDGQPKLSAIGQATYEYAVQLQANIPDPIARRNMVEALVERDKLKGRFGEIKAQPASAPAAQPPEKKERFMAQIERAPNRSGAEDADPTAREVSDPDEFFKRENRRVLREKGINDGT